ncbi:MAG: 50S ribosomal protein L6, partial [Minisyncoccia bacterium]
MSRLAKKPISIPEGVTASFEGSVMTVTGKLGSLKRNFDLDVIGISIDGNEINLALKRNTPFGRALWGTYASHIKNMLTGVTTPYTKKLILEGIGFNSEVKGKTIDLELG